MKVKKHKSAEENLNKNLIKEFIRATNKQEINLMIMMTENNSQLKMRNERKEVEICKNLLSGRR